MRTRFFAIILCALLLTTGAVIYLHIIFYVHNPLHKLEAEIVRSANKIVASELDGSQGPDDDETNRIISRIAGDDRIGKVFIIRDDNHGVLFRNVDVPLLKEDFPTHPAWITLSDSNHLVRLYNMRFPHHPERVLQVASVLDPSILDWYVINLRLVVYVTIVISLTFFISVILTYILLSPMRALSRHLIHATPEQQNLKDIGPLPPNLLKYSNRIWAGADDFATHVQAVQRLIDRININYRFSRLWAYQMAHELKTPLSILRLELEKIQEKTGLSDDVQLMLNENSKISETINSFLGWAELENSSSQKYIFANRLGTIARSVAQRLSHSSPHSIELDIGADPLVMSSQQHLEQLLSNLLSNALTYSKSSVTLQVQNRTLTITDKGPGIPQGVLDRIGEPFNRGERGSGAQGHGLGLAWVKSICRLYSWEIDIFPSTAGTKIVVTFPMPPEVTPDEARV